MTNNDVLRRLRYALNLPDPLTQKIFALGGQEASAETLAVWMKKEDEPGYIACRDEVLGAFLDGLILKRRGPRDGEAAQGAASPMETLDNNLVLKKLRIALELKEEDLIAILKRADVEVSKGELSAFFRRKDHKNYKPCLDQFLRAFLGGLAEYRKP